MPAPWEYERMKEWIRAGNNAYSILGLGEDASAFRPFRRLSRTYHPDKVSGRSEEEREEAARQFLLPSQAGNVLAHPVMREMLLAFWEMIAMGAWDPHAEPVDSTRDPNKSWYSKSRCLRRPFRKARSTLGRRPRPWPGPGRALIMTTRQQTPTVRVV